MGIASGSPRGAGWLVRRDGRWKGEVLREARIGPEEGGRGDRRLGRRRASAREWRLMKAELERVVWVIAEPGVRKCPRAGGVAGGAEETDRPVREGTV